MNGRTPTSRTGGRKKRKLDVPEQEAVNGDAVEDVQMSAPRSSRRKTSPRPVSPVPLIVSEDGEQDDGDVAAEVDETPSKRTRAKPAKATPASTPARRGGRPKKDHSTTPARSSARRKSAPKADVYTDIHPEDDDLDKDEQADQSPDEASDLDTIISQIAHAKHPIPGISSTNTDAPSTDSTSPGFETLRYIALSKLTSARPIPLQNLSTERRRVFTLLHATVSASEGNSMLILGARGSGKSALVASALSELSSHPALAGTFHVVRLDGAIQSDDRLALREIWRQLGRDVNGADEVSSAVGSGGAGSYADALSMLLGTLSHPDELMGEPSSLPNGSGNSSAKRAAHSVLFILDSFEHFAARPRQTLLYNLFDVAQARKAPIAVLGLTPRLDAADLLEKRVRSRFSHRSVLLPAGRNVAHLEDVTRAAMRVENEELRATEKMRVRDDDVHAWNAAVDTFLAASQTKDALQRVFRMSNAAPDALCAVLPAAYTLAPSPPASSSSSSTGLSSLSLPQTTPLHTLSSLPALALALLVAAARLPILHDAPHVNLALAHAEYRSLAGSARATSAVGGGGEGRGFSNATGAGAATANSVAHSGVVARAWGKQAARGAWEALMRAGLVVPESSSGGGGGAVGETEMCRVEIGLEEIEDAVRASGGVVDSVVGRWCRVL